MFTREFGCGLLVVMWCQLGLKFTGRVGLPVFKIQKAIDDKKKRVVGSRTSSAPPALHKCTYMSCATAAVFVHDRTEHGYTEVSLPLLVTRSSLEGTGQLPKFEDDLFKTNHLVANEDSFLIPTGEVPLTNLLRGQLLDKAQVPNNALHQKAHERSNHVADWMLIRLVSLVNWTRPPSR